ncbi:MAG: C69 family dipeptidase, partial [Blastocatellia bacterium]
MGANERGVAIGNEAVFTRLPYAKTGLTGLDLLRLALERGATAREALEIILDLIRRHGQGGGCGYRNRSFRYHNSFIIADAQESWVLETAGPYWAGERVRGLRTISNALSIGNNFDLISEDAYPFAKAQGWCKSVEDFDFARCFADPRYTRLSGGRIRSACTLGALRGRGSNLEGFLSGLRDHAGFDPADGWVMKMPCAHSSWRPARRAGQTTGSMIASLGPESPTLWFTGTSSPCLGVFKPARFGSEILSTGPAPGEGYDPQSLFWRHEGLHRLVLQKYEARKELFDADRQDLERRALASAAPATASNRDFQQYWDEHRQAVASWASRILKDSRSGLFTSPFQMYWKRQESMDGFPPRYGASPPRTPEVSL